MCKISKRHLLTGASGTCVLTLTGSLFGGSAFDNDGDAPETLILDPSRRRWVRYTPRIAQRFYQVRGSVPQQSARRLELKKTDILPVDSRLLVRGVYQVDLRV